MRFLKSSICALFLFTAIHAVTVSAAGVVISKGRSVSFDYTLTVDDQIIDTSKGKQPLKYVHGSGAIIPGLEKQLEGLKVGDEKSVTVAPQDGYGLVDPNGFHEVPKANLPPGATPKVGMILEMRSPQGQSFPAMISEVKPTSVVLNLNHPLAGKVLHFLVKIVDIQ